MNTAELFLPHVRDHIIPTYTGDMDLSAFKTPSVLTPFGIPARAAKACCGLTTGVFFSVTEKNLIAE